jgi:mannitol-1-phosphate 5-dehydrogenase
MRKTVVQFGAGNIGRGFMGQIFTDAGYEVVFVDVSPELIRQLNETRAYPLQFAGPTHFDRRTIGPVRAVNGRDLEAVAAELEQCDFACTAVGGGALPHLAPALAAGIRRRAAPLDVILCENQLHCDRWFRGILAQHLTGAELARVGLVESVVSRMVPVVPPEIREEEPLLAIAEDYSVLPVDARGFVGTPPEVPAMELAERFQARVEQKLYVHNLGHAVAAYLGHQAGCRFIHEAMERPEIREVVAGAMREGGEALVRKHGVPPADVKQYVDNLLVRLANPRLQDTVLRVGRDPARKLREDDRLVGAGLACLEQGVEPVNVVRGIVAALRFAPEDDPTAPEVQQWVEQYGPLGALRELAGLEPEHPLARRVMAQWNDRSR